MCKLDAKWVVNPEHVVVSAEPEAWVMQTLPSSLAIPPKHLSSALLDCGCSPTQKGPWGRSAAPRVAVLGRGEGWHSVGMGWSVGMQRDSERTAYLHLQGYRLRSGQGTSMSGSGLIFLDQLVCYGRQGEREMKTSFLGFFFFKSSNNYFPL